MAGARDHRAGRCDDILPARESGVPGRFVGSAVGPSSVGDQPLVAIVNQVHAARDVAMTYRAFGGGTAALAVPFVARDADGWNAGVQVRKNWHNGHAGSRDLRARTAVLHRR